MPSKKKKYNARFPPARIKKIMQTDEEVGKVAAAVPVIISRALELFIDSLIEKTASITKDKHAKTLSTSHVFIKDPQSTAEILREINLSRTRFNNELRKMNVERKQAIHSEKTFDFLRDLVKNVPDHQADEDDGGLIASGSGVTEPKPKQPKPRKTREPSDKTKENPSGKRGPGRPKKVQTAEVKKESSADEDTEETDTDEEQNTSEQEQGQPGNFMSPVGARPVSCISDNKQVVSNPFMSSQPTGVTEVSGPYPGPVINAQSDCQSSQTSSHLQYPGTNTLHQMQPAFQTPVQSYPMHNIPIPPYPYPMALPQGNMSQFNEFSPNPTFNGSNKNSPQFIPPMVHPYMPPIVGMPPTGFMMPPPPQDGLPYMSMYGNIPGGSHSLSVPQTEADLHPPYPPQKKISEPKNCEMPLDMTVAGKIRSQSIIEPPREDHLQTESNQTDTGTTSSPMGNRLQPEQGNVGGPSTEQNKVTNGPAMEVNSKHNSKLHNMSPRKSAVKSSDSITRSNSVEKTTVMKDKKRNKVDSSIEYHALSSLMNRGPAKIVNNEEEEDYDT